MKAVTIAPRENMNRFWFLTLSIYCSIVIFFLLSIDAYSQTINYEWAQSTGGTGKDFVNSIAADKDGNLYVTGCFHSITIQFGKTTLTNSFTSGSADGFLVKYNSNGNVLWAKKIGGPNDNLCHDVTTDTSGNVYLVGSYEIAQKYTSKSNAFLSKYDSNGNELWTTKITSKSSVWVNGVSTDGNDNVYITGGAYASSTFGGTKTIGNYKKGNDDGYVAKYNSDGEILWVKRFGATDVENGMDIACDTSGGVYITGYFYSSIKFSETLALGGYGSFDAFVAKYDSDGNALWADSGTGGKEWDEGHSIAVDTDSNIYVSGSFTSSSIKFGNHSLSRITSGPASRSGDVFIVKYDSDGNALWAKNGTGTIWSKKTSIAADNLGNVFVTGSFKSIPGKFESKTVIPRGGKDVYILNYDKDGKLLLAEGIGGFEGEYSEHHSVTTGEDGNAFIVGYYYSPNLTFGSTKVTNTNSGKSDIFVAKFQIVDDNRSPEITSNPVTTATVGVEYIYDVKATDPDDDDVLVYSLKKSPAGMSINSSTGQIKWTASETQSGSHDIIVEVSYGRDSSDTQSFTIDVVVISDGKFVVNYSKGINLISVPLDPGETWHASDLLEYIGPEASMIIWYDSRNENFTTYLPRFPKGSPADATIRGGEGYILMMTAAKEVTYEGKAWQGVSSAFSPAFVLSEGNDVKTPLFAVTGLLTDEDGSYLDGIEVTVENLSTGQRDFSFSGTTAGNGQYVVTLGSFAGTIAAQLDDTLLIVFEGLQKGFLKQSVKLKVTRDNIREANAVVDFTLKRQPTKTVLMQNYPNPFNPETWIPHQLSQDSPVTINIYNTTGQLIRTIALGNKPAGVYVTKSNAAHWDGRDSLGDKVASGVYFYTLQAGEYKATRKMVIIK